MYAITRRGDLLAAARQARDIPARVIPYAASTALTKTAQFAQAAVVAAMPRVFDRPTSYTFNALRVIPSTVETLTARIAVKDQAGAGGTRPESYLLPEVQGGIRQEKRFERALRYAGVLRPGERVVPGQDAPLDAAGNLSGATVRGILRQLQASRAQAAAPLARAGKRGLKKGYFAGAVGKKGARGVWERDGRQIKPILIFTTKPPNYSRRLDFTGIAEKTARAEFPRLFDAASAALIARRG